jgi:hypothetical protein
VEEEGAGHDRVGEEQLHPRTSCGLIVTSRPSALRAHACGVELRDRAREQAEGFARAVAGLDQQVVLDEVDARREGARVVAIRDDPRLGRFWGDLLLGLLP